MVTQEPNSVPKVKKMKAKTKKKTKKKNKKKIQGVGSESEGESIDLSEKLYPLSHYVSNQEELVNQMFRTIRGSKLEAMMPSALKSIPFKELKKLCLHELQGMSKKRILACINGQEMEGSSGSEDDEEEEEEKKEEEPKQENRPIETTTRDKRKTVEGEEIPESFLLKKIKVEPGTENGKGCETGKSVMDLLELEMRARIIKKILGKGDDGAVIPEDAIAAVMQMTACEDLCPGKTFREEREKLEENNKDHSNEKGRKSRTGRSSHRRAHSSKDSRGSRRRSVPEKSGDSHHPGKQGRKPREASASSRRKKITRKEFEERMKRAKENRTYRKRKASEDEEKEKDEKEKDKEKDKDKEEVECKENLEKKDKEDQNDVNSEDKKKDTSENETEERSENLGIVEGEASEKEEGEIDSNEEEEEGACSPSDFSRSSSCCSLSRSYSSNSSRSRSYSRSPSPYSSRRRGRRRKSRSRSSRSRSRSSRSRSSRSYSRSRSRTPEQKGRYRRVNHTRSRSRERKVGNDRCSSRDGTGKDRGEKSKDTGISRNPTKPKQPNKSKEDEEEEEEDNWGHKCDIEFVDSEEDFDDNPDEPPNSEKATISKTAERSSISFCLQKKSAPNITPGVDLDDLPLKRKQGTSDSQVTDVGFMKVIKKEKKCSEEIIISSDSEEERKMAILPVPESLSNQSKGLSRNIEPDIKSSFSRNNGKNMNNDEKDNSGNHSDPLHKSLNEKTHFEEDITYTDSQVLKDSGDNGNFESNKVNETFQINTNIISGVTESTIEQTSCTKDKSQPNAEEPKLDSVDSAEDKEMSSSRSHCQLEAKISTENLEENTSLGNNITEVAALDSVKTVPIYEGEVKECGETLGGDGEPKVEASDSLRETVNERESPTFASITYPENKEKQQDLGVSQENEVTENLEMDAECKIDSDISDVEHTVAYPIPPKIHVSVSLDDTDLRNETKEKQHESEKCFKSTDVDIGELKEPCENSNREISVFVNKEQKILLDSEELDKEHAQDDVVLSEVGSVSDSDIPRKDIGEKSRINEGERKSEEYKDIQTIEANSSNVFATTSKETIEASESDDNGKDKVPSSVSECLKPCDEATSSPQETPLDVSSESPNLNPDESLGGTSRDTEIIGVIESVEDRGAGQTATEDIDLGSASWSMRWLQSEKVQKVMSSSKMLSRIRKKIQIKGKKTKEVMEKKEEASQPPPEPQVSVIGSIEEYERLFGTKVRSSSEPATTEPVSQSSTAVTPAVSTITEQKPAPIFGSDDEGEDSEEEALWSKILKK